MQNNRDPPNKTLTWGDIVFEKWNRAEGLVRFAEHFHNTFRPSALLNDSGDPWVWEIFGVLHITTINFLEVVEDPQIFQELQLDLVKTIQSPLIHPADVWSGMMARFILFFNVFRDLIPRTVYWWALLPFLWYGGWWWRWYCCYWWQRFCWRCL